MWSRAVDRAGLPDVTFHSLRHSHASALICAGLDVVRVSRQLGHSKPTITLSVYAHEFEEADPGKNWHPNWHPTSRDSLLSTRTTRRIIFGNFLEILGLKVHRGISKYHCHTRFELVC